MLLVMIFGLVMMTRFGGPSGGPFGIFVIVWIVMGVTGATMAFYNALSKEGLPLYEVELEDEARARRQAGDGFCPQCGYPVDEGDQFCRHCGAPLGE